MIQHVCSFALQRFNTIFITFLRLGTLYPEITPDTPGMKNEPTTTIQCLPTTLTRNISPAERDNVGGDFLNSELDVDVRAATVRTTACAQILQLFL